MKKKHTIFSFVDILLVVFIFTLTATLATYSFRNNERFDFATKESITITFRAKEMPKKYEDNIKIKDSLYFNDSSDSFGRIKYINFSNSSVEFLDKLTNTSSIYKSPDKIDMILSADCEAVITDGVYLVNDVTINTGDVVELSAPNYSFSATIIKIEKNEV